MSSLRANAPSYIPVEQLLRAPPFVPQAMAQRMLAAPEFVPQARRFNQPAAPRNNMARRQRTAENIAENVRNMNALQRNINRTVRNGTGGKYKTQRKQRSKRRSRTRRS